MRFENNTIILDEVINPKKITGTRFAAVLGLNPHSMPFETWCEITHTYESPFEDSKYTIAGKIIEPKQAEYIRNNYCSSIVYPKDIYGEDYFNITYGNFFNDPHFGGMWDYLDQADGKIRGVFEMKTTSKAKAGDWRGKKIPEYYALQASLYAWLLNTDRVIMVVSFLDNRAGDYDWPERVILNKDNTKIIEFKVSERYPNFENDYIKPALAWWERHVDTGVSPEYDPIQDAEILSIIKDKNGMNELELVKSDAQMKVDASANAILGTLDEVVKSYTEQLDELMLAIQDDIVNCDDPPINLVERYFLEISNAIYFIAAKVERLSVYDGMGKLNLKEKYNQEYLNGLIGPDGHKRPSPELVSLAENNSKGESVISDMYNKAYKIVKAKIEAAQTMCATLSKVYSIKSQQAQIDTRLERANTRQVLNEGGYY